MTESIELTKKGIYNIEEGQERFPKPFVLKMLQQFKTPRKLDNSHDLPKK